MIKKSLGRRGQQAAANKGTEVPGGLMLSQQVIPGTLPSLVRPRPSHRVFSAILGMSMAKGKGNGAGRRLHTMGYTLEGNRGSRAHLNLHANHVSVS